MTLKKKRGAGGSAEREAAGAAVGVAPGGTEAGPGAPQDIYSLRQLAGLLKVDRNRLAERVRDLESFPGPHGSRLYSLSAVEEVLAEDPDPDIREARLRKLVAEAGLAELKLKRERGEVVAVDDVREDLRETIRLMYDRLAVSMPQRLGPLLVAKTARQAEQVLRAEVGREFAELRAEFVQQLAEWDAAEEGKGGAAGAGA